MNRPSNSASSASWRLVIGSTSTDSFSAMRAKCLIEFGDQRARRRLLVFVRVVQHGEIVFGDPARLGVAPLPLGVVAVSDWRKKLAFAVGQPGDGAGPDAVDRQPGARLDDRLQCRAAEPVEQEPAERLEARVASGN